GQADGRYSIGDLEVVVKEGIARLSSNQALAGSTLTMNQAVSNAIAFGFSADLIENAAINLPNRLLHLG
ncbi:MAG: N-acetylglucosamine-6-phosphate deacetylase, partial [Candidatus Nanopelagicaceae bacterium]